MIGTYIMQKWGKFIAAQQLKEICRSQSGGKKLFVMKSMLVRLIVFIFISLGSLTAADGQPPELVRKIRTTIDSSYTYFGYDIRLQNKTSQAYDSLFSLLSETLRQNPPPTINENTID